MKTIRIPFLLLLFSSCKGQPQNTGIKTNTHSDNKECSRFYSFDGAWYDLEHLQQADIGGLPIDFKDCSPYGWQFHTPFAEKVSYQKHNFTLSNEKHELYIVAEGSSQIKTIKLPVADPLPEVNEYSFSMLAAPNGVVVIMDDFYDTKYTLVKYDENGKEVSKTIIDHTLVTHPNPNEDHHDRYLYLGCTTPTQLVFTSHMSFTKTDKTIVLGLQDFSKTAYDYKLSGIVLDETQQYAKGFISQNKQDFTVRFPETKKEISFTIPNADGACGTILKGDKLVVTNYHPIATGSSLYCFDANTGKQVWKADVRQVNASHSEYQNNVYLSLYKKTIVMEGVESYGKYLQFFDLETGKRLACHGIPDFTDKE